MRGELLNVERLEEKAKDLAASHTLARKARRGARAFLARLDDNAAVLRQAYLRLAEDVHQDAFISPAAEWLLDNFYLIESEIRDVRRNLPRQFYLELPKLASREIAGVARVFAMATAIIRYSDGRFDANRLTRFMVAYQSVAPLTIGELWAWASMLKLALIENLRLLAEDALGSRRDREAADRLMAELDAAAEGRTPELPPALRSAYVVQVLQRMREYGPKAAEPTGEAQLRVALKCVESARQATEQNPQDRSAHVGHHLIGKGRRDLETDVAFHPKRGQRVRRFLFAHSTAAYLGLILLLTALGIYLAGEYAMYEGVAGWKIVALAMLLAAVPASELAVNLVQRALAAL